jgi:hypothetical protein
MATKRAQTSTPAAAPAPTLTAEIDATTVTKKPVRLPVGAEVRRVDVEGLAARMGVRPIRVHVKCPGAECFAPYDLDPRDLAFALEQD